MACGNYNRGNYKFVVDIERLFVFNGIERMFDTHMFAKHSFDVKHLFEILTKTAYTSVSVTPQEQSGAMTAILTHPADSPSVRHRVTTRPVVVPSAAHGQRIVQPAEVYQRRRLLVLAVVLSLFVGLWSFGNSAQSTNTTDTRSPDAVVVVVQPGDTLWTIATWLDPGSDPRRLVDALDDLTGSSRLLPGELLTIPAKLLE